MTVQEEGEILLGYLELLFVNNNWLELKDRLGDLLVEGTITKEIFKR